jgi:hypothetical protein
MKKVFIGFGEILAIRVVHRTDGRLAIAPRECRE